MRAYGCAMLRATALTLLTIGMIADFIVHIVKTLFRFSTHQQNSLPFPRCVPGSCLANSEPQYAGTSTNPAHVALCHPSYQTPGFLEHASKPRRCPAICPGSLRSRYFPPAGCA